MTYLDWLDKHHLHKWDVSPRIAFDAGYEEGQQAERERIRARVRIAAKKTWPAGDWFVGQPHNNVKAFVEELLRDDDEQP